VEVESIDLQLTKVLGGDLLSNWVATAIEPRADEEAAAIGGVADQADDRLVRAERPTAAIDRNEREKPVFDLVSRLARDWRRQRARAFSTVG
jgi:hypothetical protein